MSLVEKSCLCYWPKNHFRKARMEVVCWGAFMKGREVRHLSRGAGDVFLNPLWHFWLWVEQCVGGTFGRLLGAGE
ncbi:MAG: hypothetical protein M2R45_04798 [Verrucomicrobia subdivision 3 bacterium]|nr:hypothetical protein [Limisphaerales bacterium]MCS1417443.1 hypothetical protein [Limisphaerales bacterium]